MVDPTREVDWMDRDCMGTVDCAGQVYLRMEVDWAWPVDWEMGDRWTDGVLGRGSHRHYCRLRSQWIQRVATAVDRLKFAGASLGERG